MPVESALRIVGPGPLGATILDIDSRGIVSGAGYMIDSHKYIRADLLAGSIDNYIFTNNDPLAIFNITNIAAQIATAGGSSAVVTVKVCTSAVAPASGVAQHSTPIDLTTVGPALIKPTITTTTNINPGDSISLDFGGTLTALIGCITLQLKRIA